jgi:hypothetical protein
MSINLNNNLPAPPTGGTNVNFQEDGSGNVSAYVGLASNKIITAPVVKSYVLSAAATAGGGSTVYTGTIVVPVNSLVGLLFTVSGFVATPANNGTFLCTANNGTTTITLANTAGVLEVQAAAAISGSLILDCSLGNSFFVNVTAPITSMSITNPTDGQEITILWQQDVTGHAVAVAGNLLGTFSVTLTANTHSCYKWTYNLADTNWYLINSNNM